MQISGLLHLIHIGCNYVIAVWKRQPVKPARKMMPNLNIKVEKTAICLPKGQTMAGTVGLEPTTNGFGDHSSA